MYRAVYLLGPSDDLALAVPFTYQLELTSENEVSLSVIARDSAQIECRSWSIASEDPIQTVRIIAEDHEWQRKKAHFRVEIARLQGSPTIPSDRRKCVAHELDKALKTPQDLVHLAKGIETSRKTSSKSRSWMADWLEEPAAITLIRNLKSAAVEILKRRTILLAPKDLDRSLRPQDKQFLRNAAIELHKSMSAYAANQLNVGFLQYVPKPTPVIVKTPLSEESDQVSKQQQGSKKPQKSKHPPAPFDLLAALVKELQIQTSIGLLRRGEDYAKAGPILLEGRTGTGKSLAAELIARNLKKSFISINIAAVTPSLIEARMRGYDKGSFTGADKDKKGWFEEADNKVLFLDEVQSADIPSQTQLLDLLSAVSDDVTISRMGQDAESRRYSVKVILAVNEPINHLIKAGRLREDLYHRIRSVIHFPPLKELIGESVDENPQTSGATFLTTLLFIYRWKAAPCLDPSIEDTASSLQNLAALFPAFAPGTLDRIIAHPWDGNFRELERFAFDLYWRLDKSGVQGKVTMEIVDDELRAAILRTTSRAHHEPNSQGEENLIVVLRQIERCLRSENFVIDRVLPHLVPFNIRTRSKLKNYLLEHVNKLSQDVRNERAIRSFLKLEKLGG